ncbi:UHRF1-binding protein 1-like isoform X2 [Solanum tuberosum]|uniref:UHRF1-binding protein 1-like isoform X2 n=1 Tax=Solanum tuberosum TaxID=4113 RepID=UPI00073A131C|nr:PREDICTED: UHRF1-binding protein 1-like isoform X2 [Solanum tuberosum]XP_015170177.1 PREDICTED: UHRF1-binding protein 1-like isoform X2 [Solanum tuberosum]XP_015170178.1 PREDICTED: UHRF1-binding protein 1-like isoform X2 [Solanum tuberosum]
MESILARALEYTLNCWLKSFTRDQFKLKGHTAQLFNLDINGDAIHTCTGLPRRLNVTTAKVGKLKIIVPSVINVQTEPIVVQIDRLDLVLEERDDIDKPKSPSSPVSSGSSSKGSGYGFADKIADGMTLQVHTVNLLFETHGGAQRVGEASASWAPMASITIRNLLLYTTNEKWEVVNLKEARNYSRGKENIYVFKKLKWEHLSIDLSPHPDMFVDAKFGSSQGWSNKRDEDG